MGGLVGGKSVAQVPASISGLNVQTSSYGAAIPIAYGTTRIGNNFVWYADFTVHNPTSSGGGKGGGSGAGKGGKGGGGSGTTYSVSWQGVVCEGPIQGFGPNMWLSQVESTVAAQSVNTSVGYYAQSPWSYLKSTYPSQAFTYSGLAWTAAAGYNLNTSPTLPNFNFEVFATYSNNSLIFATSVPTTAPYEIQAPGAVVSGTFTNGQGKTIAKTSVYFIGDNGVNYQSGGALTNVPSSPGTGQYAVDTSTNQTAGTYTFAAGDAGKPIFIKYSAYGDADPSAIVVDLLTNPNYGAGFPAKRVGTGTQANEAHTIPAGGTITVSNSSAYLYNLDVVDNSGNIYAAVASSPGVQQYTVNYATGKYVFNTGNVGANITIRYVWLNNLLAYKTWTWASGLLMSPVYDNQTQTAQILDNIAKLTYSEWVWSSGVLTLVPRGESNLTPTIYPNDGNSYVYTAPVTPLFNLTDDDFMPNDFPTGTSGGSSNNDPLIVTRSAQSDQINNIKLEFLDRSNQYAPSISEVTDQAQVDRFGRRASASRTAHEFCDTGRANTSAQLQLQLQYIRNTYSFRLDPRWSILDPMDIVTVQDVYVTNGARVSVRITEITENNDGTLSFVAEEYPAGTGTTATYELDFMKGAQSNFNDDPGAVNAPIIFAPPVYITGGGLEIWVAASGQNMSIWGGYNVYVSYDGGSTYDPVTTLTGASRMGITTADFPVGSDPDTVNTFAVDMTESQATINSAPQASADADQSLWYVGGTNGIEYIDYTNATLTSQYHYSMGTYLRRGRFFSPIVDHPSGSSVVRLGTQDSIARIPYNKNQVGQTITIKLQSFNVYGGGLQSLSSVEITPYTVVLPPPPTPAAVTGFAAADNGGAVQLSWIDNLDASLKGYDILYGAVGGSVMNATLLTQASRQTAETTVAIPPGTWVTYIRGHNIADQVGPASSATITVSSTNPVVSAQIQRASFLQPSPLQEYDWLGTLSGFLIHYTGVLVPDSTVLANTLTNAQLFTQFVPSPVSNPTYTSSTVDLGFDSSVRFFATVVAVQGGNGSGVPAVTAQLDTWLTGHTDPGVYNNLQIGYTEARYFNGRIAMNTSVMSAYVARFDLTADAQIVSEAAVNIAVSASGSLYTYASLGVGPFHNIPNIQATVTDATGTSATAVTPTRTQATFFEYQGSTPISGTVNLLFTGA